MRRRLEFKPFSVSNTRQGLSRALKWQIGRGDKYKHLWLSSKKDFQKWNERYDHTLRRTGTGGNSRERKVDIYTWNYRVADYKHRPVSSRIDYARDNIQRMK